MIDTAISTEANTVHSVSILLCLIKNLKMPKRWLAGAQSEKLHTTGYCSFLFCTESYAGKNQLMLNTLRTPTATDFF